MATGDAAASATADDGVVTETKSPLADLGLPKWLDELLQPGVGPGVFMTLKLSLVALITCLIVMAYNITDEVPPRHAPCHLLTSTKIAHFA